MIVFKFGGKSLGTFEKVDAVGDLSFSKKLLKSVPEGFSVMCGNDNLFFKMKKLDADGGVCVFSNLFPNYFCSRRKNAGCASRLFNFVNANSNPAGIKCALGHFSIIGNSLREPLCAIDAKLNANYEDLLKI